MNHRFHHPHAWGVLLACVACNSDPEPSVADAGLDAGPSGTSDSEQPTFSDDTRATEDTRSIEQTTSARDTEVSTSGVEVPSSATSAPSAGTSTFDATLVSTSSAVADESIRSAGTDESTSAVEVTSSGTSAPPSETSTSDAPNESTSSAGTDESTSGVEVTSSGTSAPATETSAELSIGPLPDLLDASAGDAASSEPLDGSVEGGDAGRDSGHGTLEDAGEDASTGDGESPPLQMSTYGAWCANPIPIAVVKGGGSILNNPYDDLGQVNAELLERLTICPGEETEYCNATPEGELVSVIMRDCYLPIELCPAEGAPVTSGCSQTTMGDLMDISHIMSLYVAQGCCFEGQFAEVYTETCTAELEGTRCPASEPCLDRGYCVQGECIDGPPRNCDDGFYCNGEEYCLEDVGCMPGAVPQFDNDRCTDDTCFEATESVSHEPVNQCDTEVCLAPLQVNVGYIGYFGTTPTPEGAFAPPDGSVLDSRWTGSVELECGETGLPDSFPAWDDWTCALTEQGEVVVQNQWGVALSQPVASGCTYEMHEEETKLAGHNGYDGFTVGCCLGTAPFHADSPNREPPPPLLY